MLCFQEKVGVYSDEVTPVPIPNTEVKLINVDDTWLATTRESRTMPALYLIGNLRVSDFLLYVRWYNGTMSCPHKEDIGSIPIRTTDRGSLFPMNRLLLYSL